MSKRVSVNWAKAILAAAESLGIPPATILAEVPLDLSADSSISLEQTQALWQAAERLSQHPYFGICMGERVRPSYFSVVAYVAMTSSDLAQAFASFKRYMPLISEGAALDVAFEGNGAWLYFTPQPDVTPFSRHQVESVVVMVLTFSRWLIGDLIYPQAVHFQHGCGPGLEEYRRVFGVEPKFNQARNGILLPREILSRQPVESDPALFAMHTEHAERLLSAMVQQDWRSRVLQLLQREQRFDVNREWAAGKLHVSTRTLQRRLQEEGVTFADLLDDFRRQRAEHWLCHTPNSLKQVSADLGFSEPSTFYRACQRWFGCTPNQLRSIKNNNAGQDPDVPDTDDTDGI